MLKHVARNTVIGFAGNIAGLTLQFAASIIIARTLGVAGFGIYSSALAFAILFGTLSDGGVTGGLSRELVLADAVTARRLLGTGLLLKVGATAVSYLALYGITFGSGFDSNLRDVILVIGLAYMCAFLGGQTALCIARVRGHMEIDAGLTILYSLIFTLWVILAPHTPLSIAWGWVMAYAVFGIGGLAIVFRRFINPLWSLERPLIRQIWQVGLPLGFASLLLLIYMRLPFYILTAFSDPQQLGLFSAAFGLPRNLQTIVITIGGTLGPVFVQLAANDPYKLRIAYTASLRTALLLLIPLAVGGTVLAQAIVQTLFGSSYTESAPVLAFGIWSLCCYSISYVAQTLLAAQGRGTTWFVALGVGLLASCGLMLIFVPNYGALGASYATIFADLLVLLLMLMWTRAVLNSRKLLVMLLRIGISAFGMSLLLMLIAVWPIWVSIPIGASFYLVLLLITRAVLVTELMQMMILLPLPKALNRYLERLIPMNTR